MSGSCLTVCLSVFLHVCRGNRHQLDHYDHIWGIYLTKSGKRRRMDLIFVPPDCHSWVFAYVGWTGSKQYLRFMRTHAGEGLVFSYRMNILEDMLCSLCFASLAAELQLEPLAPFDVSHIGTISVLMCAVTGCDRYPMILVGLLAAGRYLRLLEVKSKQTLPACLLSSAWPMCMVVYGMATCNTSIAYDLIMQ